MEPISELKKTCKVCLELKPLSDFCADKNGKFGRASRCRNCFSKTRKTSSSVYNSRRKMLVGRVIFEHLRANPCVDCGEDDPRVLDFDHIPELGEKVMSIGEMVNKARPLHEIRLEMAKCQVRCRNCHMIRTHEVNNSWRHQLWMEMMTRVYRLARPAKTLRQLYYEDLMDALV